MNTINAKRISSLALHLQGQPQSIFDMNRYRFNCGTPACIAGHACHRFMQFPDYRRVRTPRQVHRTAAKLLGLTRRQARQLFTPRTRPWFFFNFAPYPQVTPDDVSSVLLNLAATGQVQWGDLLRRKRKTS